MGADAPPKPYDYPIAGIDRWGEHHRFERPEDFYELDAQSIRRGVWVDMRLLDSSGVTRRIVSVTPHSVAGGWYLKLQHLLGADVPQWVVLDIVEGADISLDEVKAKLLADFEAEEVPLLMASGPPNAAEGAEKLREAIRSAARFRDINENLEACFDVLEAEEAALTAHRRLWWKRLGGVGKR